MLDRKKAKKHKSYKREKKTKLQQHKLSLEYII